MRKLDFEKLRDVLGGLGGQEGQPTVDPNEKRRLSAVLVPIGYNTATGRDEIILTQRTATLETHKGQVSFPGGLLENQDRSLLDTALRESEEEIGLLPSDVEVLGPLAPLRTRFQVIIHPWVGRLTLPYAFRPSPAEVACILVLPVARLLSEGTQRVVVAVEGVSVESRGIELGGVLVWGATARLLERLREKILGE